MSKLQQYLFLGGLLVLLQWTSTGEVLRSASFLNIVSGIIGFLLIVALFVTLPRAKKRRQEHKKDPFGDSEGD